VQTVPAHTQPPATVEVSEPFYHTEFSIVPVENEYDPMRPNDYEDFVEGTYVYDRLRILFWPYVTT
jgi:hypothetical protein